MKRDFTFIDDAVEALVKCCKKKAITDENFDRYNPNPLHLFVLIEYLILGTINQLI